MKRGIDVILMPADKSPTGLFMLAAVSEKGEDFGGWAKEDGTFGEGSMMIWELDQAIGFANAQNAIDWAKASPRRWVVVNEIMFNQEQADMPSRMTVRVTEANYNPFPHEIVQRRQELGEKVVQLEIHFEAIDVSTYFVGCNLILDYDTSEYLRRAGISVEPTVAVAYMKRAYVYAQLGDKASAFADVQRARDLIESGRDTSNVDVIN